MAEGYLQRIKSLLGFKEKEEPEEFLNPKHIQDELMREYREEKDIEGVLSLIAEVKPFLEIIETEGKKACRNPDAAIEILNKAAAIELDLRNASGSANRPEPRKIRTAAGILRREFLNIIRYAKNKPEKAFENIKIVEQIVLNQMEWLKKYKEDTEKRRKAEEIEKRMLQEKTRKLEIEADNELETNNVSNWILDRVDENKLAAWVYGWASNSPQYYDLKEYNDLNYVRATAGISEQPEKKAQALALEVHDAITDRLKNQTPRRHKSAHYAIFGINNRDSKYAYISLPCDESGYFRDNKGRDGDMAPSIVIVAKDPKWNEGISALKDMLKQNPQSFFGFVLGLFPKSDYPNVTRYILIPSLRDFKKLIVLDEKEWLALPFKKF